MSEKMRATLHNGRTDSKGKSFLAKHNDRDFSSDGDGHIDRARSAENFTLHCFSRTNPDLSFEDAEKRFYEKHFSASLEKQNSRYEKSGHRERVKSIDDYRKNPRTCPEESIYQIGKMDAAVDAETLLSVYQEFLKERSKLFPSVAVLDFALHRDEQGAPHIHERKVWIAHGKDGEVVSQTKALKEMGVERPEPSKRESKWNNAKQTYSRRERSLFLDICHRRGIEIEEDPREASRSGKSLIEYQVSREKEKLSGLQDAVRTSRNAAETARERVHELQANISALEAQESEKRLKTSELSAQNEAAADALQKTLDAAVDAAQIKKPFNRRRDAYGSETITYYRSDVKALHSVVQKVKDYAVEAGEKETAVAARETAVAAKEADIDAKAKEIQPLHEKAVKDASAAAETLRDFEYKVFNTAVEIVEAEGYPVHSDECRKMRDFMNRYSVDGVSLDQLYDQEQKAERDAARRKLEEKRRSRSRARSYDWEPER